MVMQIVIFVLLPEVGNIEGTFALLILSAVAASTLFSGSIITVNTEIDPVNAPVIFSFFNGAAQVAGFLGPLLMASLTNTEEKHVGWNRFFYVMAGFAALGIVSIVVGVMVAPSEWKNRLKSKSLYRNEDKDEKKESI